MIDDFRPAQKRRKSLPVNLSSLGVEQPEIQRHTTNTTSESSSSIEGLSSTEPFHPPEEVAAIEAVQGAPNLNEGEQTARHNKGFKHHVGKFTLSWPPRKKEILVGLLVLVLISSGIGSWALMHGHPKVVTAAPRKMIATPIVPPQPTTVASTLSGLQVDKAVNARPVTAVMIENSLDARPQSGLSQSNVVFEAIAEGGITRFLALYQDTAPGAVGPVRSARPYYLQWELGFDANYAHVGGSPQAISEIKSKGVKDLDQFYNAGAYDRIKARVAPHNVYTSIDRLVALAAGKGYTASSFTGFARKAEGPSQHVTARKIDLTLSGPLYNAHYDYNPATNSYLRSEGGAAHIDANGSVQISPKVVVALVMPYGIQVDGKHSDYGTIGSGQAYIFQDGVVVSGNWTKKSDTDQFAFTDAAGKPLGLNPGQTWLTAVGSASNVTSSP
jgi:hypothetical protein